MNIPRMSYPQYRKARRLTHECCNYCNGNCLLLDDGEECVCVQSISYSLLCKYFRRCHDGRLISILCAPRHCQKSQNRFTGTHVSLNQTLHGIRSLHIFRHIMQCSSLCSRQFIRKLLNQIFHELRMFHHKPVFLSGSLFFLVLHAHDK